MKEEVSVLIDEETLIERVKALAEQINQEYAGKKVHLICILKGSVFLPANWQNILRCQLPWILCVFPVTGMV